MEQTTTLEAPDKTLVSLLFALTVVVMSVAFFFAFGLNDMIGDSGRSFQTSALPMALVGVFRYGCAYLAFHTVVFWMVRSPEPGRMFVVLHETSEEVMIRPMGFERIGTFSSWTLMVFGLAFFVAGTATWMTVFNLDVPPLLNALTVVLMPIAYGAAFITATVVRYVIIPEEISLERPFGTYFKNYELVMHNFTAIFLAVDLFLVQAQLEWQFGIFPVYFGIVYVLFSYAYARMTDGYYIYSFLDPRINMAPVYLLVLLLACCLFYFGLWGMSLLMQWNALLGGLILGFWVSRIVLFRRQVKNNPYAFQSSS
ncbi:MAG TPA: hypothetical protein HA353_04780 [Candidatus Poseidonia sp.]|nr:hypothetical protein [Poseidonia sp.]|tara:strand:- start:249 stop:1184 length:936 start_codon:yes stop_codon:yes gene_type:complete